MPADEPMGPFEKLRLFLGAVAVAVWLASIIVDAVVSTYDPPPSIQLVILIIAGSLFAPTITRKVNGEEDK